LTARHPIKPTSRRCLSAWQPNPAEAPLIDAENLFRQPGPPHRSRSCAARVLPLNKTHASSRKRETNHGVHRKKVEARMAKGYRCPWCGADQLQRGKSRKGKLRAYRRCSNCDGVGWLDLPKGTGEGSGKVCRRCEARKLHTIFTNDDCTIIHCTGCKATMVYRGRARDDLRS